jgi:ribosomal protein L12E/L44/L45/RPP1/RPP2
MSMKVEKVPSIFVPFKNHYKQKQQKKKEEEEKKKKLSEEDPSDSPGKRFIGWA